MGASFAVNGNKWFFFFLLHLFSVLALRWPWKVWGPPSLRAYHPIFASWWRYAWMKTQQRGLNLTWLCQFWKKCRTNEPPIVPVCTWTSHPRWWCGAYQYCLKLLHCCCIQGHCSSCFSDKYSSGYFYNCFVFLFIFNVMSPYSCLFWSSISAALMNEYNLQTCT